MAEKGKNGGKGFLSAPLGAKGGKQKSVRGRLPSKRSINLAGYGEKPINLKVAIPAIALIIVAAALISKFAVVDRFMAVTQAQNEAAAVQTKVDEGYRKIASFGELTEIYAHYTFSGMSQEELSRADRVATVEMIQRVVLPNALVDTWSIVGNQLTLTITGSTLQEINLIAQRLEEEELVNFCTVNTATTNELYNGYQVIEDTGTVTARIMVYLNEALEGGYRP